MGKEKFFSLYNKLIEGIPENIKIEEYNRGEYWTSIRANDSLGLAKTFDEATRPRLIDDYIGRELKEVAELSKSWNIQEASVGLAAINCYYNSISRITDAGIELDDENAFDNYREELKGKKVTVVGHFPYLENKLKDICDLRILERNPQEGDYPDSASELLLPESDYIFITSCTIVNKTFPRLIELGKGRKIIMVGPSTPIAEVLLDEGIFDLSGFIPRDIRGCINATLDPECKGLFDFGDKVSLNK